TARFVQDHTAHVLPLIYLRYCSHFMQPLATTLLYPLSLHDALPISLRDALSQVLAKSDDEKRAFADTFDSFFAFDQFKNRPASRSEEHTSELQSRENLVCRLLLEKKKITRMYIPQPSDRMFHFASLL